MIAPSVSNRLELPVPDLDGIDAGSLPMNHINRAQGDQSTKTRIPAMQNFLEECRKASNPFLQFHSNSTAEHYFALVPIDCPD